MIPEVACLLDIDPDTASYRPRKGKSLQGKGMNGTNKTMNT